MEKQETYCIRNISKKQLTVIMKSLDAYTRLGLLQFENVVNDSVNWNRIGKKNDKIADSYSKNRDTIDALLKEVRRLCVTEDDELNMYGNNHWSLGIGGDKNTLNTHIAYELEKDISISAFNDQKGKLRFTEESDVIVEEENIRKEKILKILEKMKDK